MSYVITQESFESLTAYWTDPGSQLRWGSIFVLPSWLEVWWQTFGSGAELYLCAVRQREKIVGIAPLQIRNETASFIGSADVCDYVDFVIVPGMETDFFDVLLDDLRQKGISQLELGPSRLDSTVISNLSSVARERGCEVVPCRQDDVSVELDLPQSWDEYLRILTSKQRHELKRKLRRLWEAGNVDYTIIGESAPDVIDTFLKLFSESKGEKAAFMTDKMQSFFRSLAKAMAEAKLLRFGILRLDAAPVAMVMCFDYNDNVYLYNSGYDPQYSALSIGILSKALYIQDSIQKGKRRFDFLKGAEAYKYRLGGRETPIYSCQIVIR